MSKVYFKLYNAGMINQLMSLEIATGIMAATGSQIVLYGIHSEREKPIFSSATLNNQHRKDALKNFATPSIDKIVNIDKSIILIDQDVQVFVGEDYSIDEMVHTSYCSFSKSDSKKESHFAENRSRIDFSKNVNIRGTLGWYSRFFYDRSTEIDLAISKLTFKDEYLNFAKMVSESIGEFQGMHLRLSDLSEYIFSTSLEMFEDGLKKLEKNNMKMVLCTDEPMSHYVLKNKDKYLLIDEYILSNYLKEFLQLEYHDEVILGLICMLVMTDAKFFIGTSGSTYTGYIQRVRNQKGLSQPWSFFDNPQYTQDGPYSWNGSPLQGGQKMFWREWPESKLRV